MDTARCVVVTGGRGAVSKCRGWLIAFVNGVGKNVRIVDIVHGLSTGMISAKNGKLTGDFVVAEDNAYVRYNS